MRSIAITPANIVDLSFTFSTNYRKKCLENFLPGGDSGGDSYFRK
jgi:hypothetical protein